MPEITLDDLIAIGERFARLFYEREPRGELRPLLHAMLPDGKVEIIPLGFRSDLDKRIKLAALRAALLDKGCTAYSLIVEAWMTSVSMRGKEAGRYLPGGDRYVPPRESPDRIEVVQITAVNAAGDKRAKVFELRRDQQGRVRDLIHRDELADGDVGGAMASLLDPDTVGSA